MAKANSNKAERIPEDAIKTWIDALLTGSVFTFETPWLLTDWICAGRLWAAVSPQAFTTFCEEQLTTGLSSPLHPSALLLAGIYPTREKEKSTLEEKIITFHLALAQQLDESEEGLLNHFPSKQDSTYLPLIQAAWIWAANALLERSIKSELIEPLIQHQELYLHETDRQLWDANQGFYRVFPFSAQKEAFSLPDNALAMLAGVPDQDRAEEILAWLTNHAPPWQSSEVPSSAWLGAASFILYESLLAYEMNKGANELKKYVLRHLPTSEEIPARECLVWLWENEH
jgi:hypothetical protein